MNRAARRLRSWGALAAAAACVWTAIDAAPPSKAVIETGPVGGSYHQSALAYKELLAARGIELEIRPVANTLESVGRVAAGRSGVDIGFVAQDVDPAKLDAARSIGLVQLQPLYVFASAELGRRSMLDDLRGRRIVMPPRASATSAAALRVLGLYDITEDNSEFVFMPLTEAIAELRAGRYDAGIFMLAAENPLVRQLMADSSVRLIPFLDARAISNHLPFLRAAMLPRGAYDAADSIPAADTPMVAGAVSVVARGDLHPYLVYAMLEALGRVHRLPRYIGNAGEFPTLVGLQMQPHPLAEQYHKSGMPRVYRELPPWVASAVDKHGALGLAALYAGLAWVAIESIAASIGRALARRNRRHAGAPRGRARRDGASDGHGNA
jgi:TRAP-type uncharacterized transport system substrate-binding protein